MNIYSLKQKLNFFIQKTKGYEIVLNPGVGNRPVITYAQLSQVDRVA